MIHATGIPRSGEPTSISTCNAGVRVIYSNMRRTFKYPTQGFADGSFQGDSLVTREQAIVVLNRIAKLTGIRVKEDAALSALTSFRDASQISSWAHDDVGEAISSGIIQGRSNGQIAPQEWMTRAELSAILYRWLLHTDRQS
ncbi:S-layer homology domain-containing protein [Cohnella sp. WQ 127256]|uniref:S-layer homology domain-containing protein n=1 Tax=Cohnella sp. WQ 127256 TaxID=2938790 RepID=UPI002118519A|nr:S-layer homology domain-containing protein [Cohnella sp. WQ 127256]